METVRLVHVGISLKRITSMSIAHLWHFLRHPHLQPDDGIPVNTDKIVPGPESVQNHYSTGLRPYSLLESSRIVLAS